MMARKTFSFTGIVFLVVLILALFIVSPVLADDEVPPVETSTAEVTPAPVDVEVTPALTEVPTTEAADPTLASSEQSVDITQTAEPTAEVTLGVEEATPAEALVEVLSENNLILTNSNGDEIPLASTEGATVATGSDPYFVAGGIYYGFSASGTCAAIVLPANCTTTANPISEAVNAYSTTYALTATGAIYIEAGTYSEALGININSPTLTGLIGAGSATTIINLDPGTALQVSNTTKGFTLQGLTINGNLDSSGGTALVDFNTNTGALLLQDLEVKNLNSTGDGIEVTNQTGAVTLNKVESSNNGDEGATISATGNVTITNSSFDRNYGYWNLNAESTTGAVALNGVSAYNNYGGDGATLKALKGIKITNSNFSYNSGYGLYVREESAGAITLDTVFANNNSLTNLFFYRVDSPITLNNIESIYSGDFGIYIDNCDASGSLCTSPVAGAVILTNVTATSNPTSNIYVLGSGAITATNVTSRYSNTGSTGTFDNHYAKSPSAVSVLGSTFEYAQLTNLEILSKGNVTLNNVTGYGSNTQNGVSIDNSYGTGTVTFLNTLGNSSFNSNHGYGAIITAKGNVTITGITANNNYLTGLYIENYFGTGNVSITNGTLNSNGNPSGDGLYVNSKGAITLKNVDADNNNGYGITVFNDSAPLAKPVTVTNGSTNYNDKDGLWIFSKGSILLSGFQVYGNDSVTPVYAGIYLNNLAGTGTVTVINSSADSNYKGLVILSTGNVSLDTMTTTSNTLVGADVNNSGGAAATVTIKKSSFNSNNGDTGLVVRSKGLITLTSTTASYNSNPGSYGASLDNTAGVGGVTLTGALTALNQFSHNNQMGLLINTNGPVNLNYLTTEWNGQQGLSISDTGSGTVTIANISSTSNGQEGITVTARGTITLTNPYIASNTTTNAGVYLDNLAGTGAVIVQGTSASHGRILNNNSGTSGYELAIASHGAVTVKYIDLAGAGYDGLSITNTGTALSSVTLTQVQSTNNLGMGINLNTYGTVTIVGLEVSNNGSYGLYIQNGAGGTPKNVSVSLATAYQNGSTGIRILSQGAVTLAGIQSTNALSGTGIYVNTPAAITLTYSGSVSNLVSSNPGYGVYFLTNGNVVINKTTAENNGSTNIYVDNSSGAGTITLNTVTANNSTFENGIYLRTNGNVSITFAWANSNNAYGLDLDNRTGNGNVTITNGTFYDNDFGDGARILTHGIVTLTAVSADNNTNGYAVYIDNHEAIGTPGVTVQSTSPIVNEFYNNLSGLYILSKGAVKLVNVTANANTNTSVNVDNTYGLAGVTLTNITGTSSSSNAIDIETLGAVTGSILKGTGGSSSPAILIDNCQYSGTCQGAGNVTLTNVTINYSPKGLEVYSNGAITVSDLTSNNIYNGYGAFLDNHQSTMVMPVSVLKATTNQNYYDGIRILSRGNVILDGITSTNNYHGGSNGVTVDNSYNLAGTANVSLLTTKGANTFSNNANDGLKVISKGTILVTNVTGNDNGGVGLNLQTTGTAKTITVTTAYVKNNYYYGILAQGTAAFTFTGVKAFNNGITSNLDGINVDTGGNNFTISNSIITGNGRDGIFAFTGASSQVKLSNTIYFGNDHHSSGSGAPDIWTDGILTFS